MGGGVAYWAHVGGFVFGMGATWLLFRSQLRRDPYIPPFPPPSYPY
jgi:membrane associated rhomboid family serine protease